VKRRPPDQGADPPEPSELTDKEQDNCQERPRVWEKFLPSTLEPGTAQWWQEREGCPARHQDPRRLNSARAVLRVRPAARLEARIGDMPGGEGIRQHNGQRGATSRASTSVQGSAAKSAKSSCDTMQATRGRCQKWLA
jgi:hypothetical protein